MNVKFMDTIDWDRTLKVEQYGTGHYYVKYILPSDLTESGIRQNFGDWCIENVQSLFKVYKISDDFMREIQANMTEEDIRQLEHEIMIDCYMVRQCFTEQIENHLTYMRACVVKYEEALLQYNNREKLLRRLQRMYISFSVDGNKASFVDYDGRVTDQIVF